MRKTFLYKHNLYPFAKGSILPASQLVHSSRLVILFLLLVFATIVSRAQSSTETFETESPGSTAFNDNGQTFNITSQAGGPFAIFNSTGSGWNGSSPDNVYIDNINNISSNTVQFTISSASATPFITNYFFLYLSDLSFNNAVSGSVTITGKRGGITIFTATASSGFNQNPNVNNGFSLINLSGFGGQNNGNKIIDQLVISTGSNFGYVALDAFNWSTTPEINVKGNNVSIVDGDITPSYTDSTSYGTTDVCSGAIVRKYIIENTGSGTLTISGVSITGAASGDFSVTTAPASTVARGNTTTFLVTFNPSGTGARNATITINNNDADEAVYDFTITGTGSSPAVTPTFQTNLSCNGGSNGAASVTVSGGIAPYTYDWTPGTPTGDGSNSITGLTAGSWTCTVTDASGCTGSYTFTITQPSTLSVTALSQTNVSCLAGSNGSASVTVSGGTPAYTYDWSPGTPSGDGTASVTGLSAGTWTCTVTDANGCTKALSFTIQNGTSINWTGSTSTDWGTASNWCGGIPGSTSNVIIPSGAPNQPVINASATVHDLTVQTGASLSVNASLTVAGTISNSGVINASSGSITLDGNSTQNITPGLFNTNTVNNLVINNPNSVTLGTDFTVLSNLTLTNGDLSLGTYTITAGTISGGGAASYLQTNGSGAVKVSIANGAQVLVPVGNSAYNPVSVTNNSGASDVFTFNVLDEVYANGSNGTALTQNRVQRTWNIGKANPNGGSGINFTFYWNSGEVSAAMSTPSLYHYGSQWVRQSGTTSSTATSLSYTGYSGSFSPFAIVDASFTLPVTQLSFKATNGANLVLLDWSTATEENTDQFLVQHSPTGTNWVNLGFVKAAGNSTSLKQYRFVDRQPMPGLNYYRLAQQDIDGKTVYSSVLRVNFTLSEKSLEVYPNPAQNNRIMVKLYQPANLQVFNAAGALVLQKSMPAGMHELNMSSLAAGSYHILAAGRSALVIIPR